MIFIDIEGTLSPGKYKALDLHWLYKIQKELIPKVKEKKIKLAICTGRPQPYVEAMMQALDAKTWAVCENGAVLYNSETDEVVFNQNIPKNYRKLKKKIEKIIRLELEKESKKNNKLKGWRQEIGKEFIISLNTPINTPIETFHSIIYNMLEKYHDKLEITHSQSAVDIAPKNISKMDGIKWVLKQLGIKPENAAGIGDAKNDKEMLEFVGLPAAPVNASLEIKKIVNNRKGLVFNTPDTRATYDLIKHCI